MGPTTDRDNLIRSRVAPPDVSVSNWFLRDGGISAWSFALLCAGISYFAARMTNHLPTGAVCFVALALTSWRLWIPVRFDLGTNGIVQRSLGYERRLQWAQFCDCEFRERGALLVPNTRLGNGGTARPLYVLWGNQRDSIRSVLEFYVGRSRAGGSSVTRIRVTENRPSSSAG